MTHNKKEWGEFAIGLILAATGDVFSFVYLPQNFMWLAIGGITIIGVLLGIISFDGGW